MQVFRANITCENAAFDDLRPELVRILRSIADHVENGGTIDFYQTVRDGNGNDVGRYKLINE